jgi:hypothetical protein
VAKASKDLQPGDITELRHFHEEELSAEDLVEQKTLTILPEEAEEDVPAPVDLLTIPNLQKALKMCEESTNFLQNLHAYYMPGSLMRRNIYCSGAI